LTAPQAKGVALAADNALATQRLKTFITDNTLRPAHEYGSTTTTQARRRKEEMLKGFEEDFNKINSRTEAGDGGTYIQRDKDA
jgi:hypothetical protein